MVQKFSRVALRKLVSIHRRQIFPVQSASQVKIEEVLCIWVDLAAFLTDYIPENFGFFSECISYSWIRFLVKTVRDSSHGLREAAMCTLVRDKETMKEKRKSLSIIAYPLNSLQTFKVKLSKINASLGKHILVWQILLTSTALYLIIESGKVLMNFFGSLIHLLNLCLTNLLKKDYFIFPFISTVDTRNLAIQ